MNEKIPYFYQRIDDNGFVHSIDMIYLEGFGICPNFKKFCKKHNLEFEEGETTRTNKYLSVYSYFNFDSVGIDLCYLVGRGERHCEYDDDKEVWMIRPGAVMAADYFVIRFNPNKICTRPWFYDFVELIKQWSDKHYSMLYLKKFDYAIDLDVPIKDLFIKSRKSSGRVNDTLYFGKAGRNGYLKVYNKTVELKKQGIDIEGINTRVEYTFKTSEEFSFDDISKLDISLLESDEINQTDKFILKAFYMLREQYPDLDLQKEILRTKFEKLRNHIMVKSEIPSAELMLSLLNDYFDLFHCLSSGDESVEVEDLESFILEKTS